LRDYEKTALLVLRAVIVLVREFSNEASLRDVVAVACQLATNWIPAPSRPREAVNKSRCRVWSAKAKAYR
jgi:hypothetical protein